MPQRYCTNCGKLISSHSNYCQFCGSAQRGFEAMAQKAMNKQIKQHPEKFDDKPSSSPGQEAQPSSDTPAKTSTKKSGPAPIPKKQTYDTDVSITPQRTIEKRRLCQRAVWSFYLSYISKTGLLLLLFLVGSFFDPLLFGLLLISYVMILYITAAIVHRNYYFEVNSSSFRKEYGVLHKIDVTIPFNRIQNVNITRSLSDRILGLSRIDIESAGSSSTTKRNTAGGSNTKSEGHLPGVTLHQAKEIHDLLIDRFSAFQNQPDSTNP